MLLVAVAPGKLGSCVPVHRSVPHRQLSDPGSEQEPLDGERTGCLCLGPTSLICSVVGALRCDCVGSCASSPRVA